MKKLTLLLALLGGLLTAAQAQTGVIGINTVNPQGVLHIDGIGNNPQSGSVGAAQAEDDVIIDASGRIGIGLPNPATRVDILPEPSGTPGDPLLRIKDGTEEEGAFLFSADDYGTGIWAHVAVGGWYAALYNDHSSPTLGSSGASLDIREFTSNHYDYSLISSTVAGNLSTAAGTITVPYDSQYRINVSIYWETTRTVPFKPTGILRLRRAGVVSDLWTFFFWGGNYANENVLPTFMKIIELKAGDDLFLATDDQAPENPNNARVHLFLVERLL
jgi:hypothetical protein